MKKIFFAVIALMVLSMAYTNASAGQCDPNQPNSAVDYGCMTDYVGSVGVVGPQGPVGPTGATGPQGPAGTDGADGATGATGPAGSDGVDGVDGTVDYTGLATTSSVNDVQNTIIENDNRLIGGMAGLAAMAAIPDVHGTDTGIGIGFSNYRGANGIAIGLVHRADNLTWKLTGATNSLEQDDWILNAGATFGF